MQTENTPDEVRQPHVVSVRSLVEFVLSAGDITPGGFQRRDRAQLGTQGHQRVQRSRPAGYETEVEIAFNIFRPFFPSSNKIDRSSVIWDR